MDNKENDCEVNLDFTGVNFISRSFADQFFIEKSKLEEDKHLRVVTLNANEDIISIIQTVSKTQYNPSREFKKYPVLKFTDTEKLQDYMLSI